LRSCVSAARPPVHSLRPCGLQRHRLQEGTKSSEALATTHDLWASVKATLRIERESRNEGAFQRTTLEQAWPHIAAARREWRGRCRPKVHSRLGLSGAVLKQMRRRERDYSD
jgi:hypothetical protein